MNADDFSPVLASLGWAIILVPMLIGCVIAACLKWPLYATNLGLIISMIVVFVFVENAVTEFISVSFFLLSMLVDLAVWLDSRRRKGDRKEEGEALARMIAREIAKVAGDKNKPDPYFPSQPSGA